LSSSDVAVFLALSSFFFPCNQNKTIKLTTTTTTSTTTTTTTTINLTTTTTVEAGATVVRALF
jgi:hypothetical protein